MIVWIRAPPSASWVPTVCSKPMRRDRRLPVRSINEASSRASGFERVLEQISAADRLAAVNEHPVDVATGPSIVVRRGGSRLRCSISSRNASAACGCSGIMRSA